LQKPLHIPTEAAMLTFGQVLAKSCGDQGAWIYLCGELGAGKTTLVRGFLQGLGYEERVKSPTYTLVEPYEIGGRFIYHCDFYRLSQAAELTYLGLEEYFTQSSVCLVEWPDHFMNRLPIPDMLICLTPHNQERLLQLESKTPRGVAIMEHFLHD